MKLIITILLSIISIAANAQVYGKFYLANTVPAPTPIVTPGTGAFTFNLATTARVSIGVFKNDSILIRTLLADSVITAGTHTMYWNGRDDFGTYITSNDSLYKIKVMDNNVRYTWQGTIGNTSDSMYGPAKHKGAYDCMKGLVFAGSFGYFCTGYGEGNPSVAKFNIATPNQKISIYPTAATTGDVNYVCTDGTNVYWGCLDPFQSNNTWVFGTKVSDDTEVPFSSGVPYSLLIGYKTYNNTISKLNQNNSGISGLAVQRTGNFLFVARKDLNQLQVLNKTTGAVAQTLTFSNARNLCVDGSDNLWMVSGTNTVSKYTVGGTGTLSAVLLTISSTLDPLALQVSYDGTKLAITDGSTSQQVKFYNNSTGAIISTQGTAGGYVSNATVTNSKFYFNDVREKKHPFVAYQSDGSYWVNDPGNFRVQHYNSAGTFLNRIQSLGAQYSTWVDRNNITRVFGEYLEFQVDYAVQNLTGSTGWTLVKNWGAAVTTAYDQFVKIKHITTLSNGRTYGLLNKGGYKEVVELTDSLRFTGVLRNNIAVLCKDGSIQDYSEVGSNVQMLRYPLTGFSSNNPTWSTTPEILATVPKHDVIIGGPGTTPNTQIYDGYKFVFFNGSPFVENSSTVFSSGYHVGIGTRNNTGYLSQTEKSTHRNYGGAYPKAGWFDIGNSVNGYAGGNVNILGRHIITSYHGEFWKGSQTNKFNHYYDNGLAIGQFGTTGPEVRYGIGLSSDSKAEFAGNVLSAVLVDGDSVKYLYHGDEGVHAAVHRWKISNLASIHDTTITIPFPSAYVTPALNYTDLMSGVPFDAPLLNNTAGWTKSPTVNTPVWKVNTSITTYEKSQRDININFDTTTTATCNVSRVLGTNNVTSDWKLAGDIAWVGSIVQSEPIYAYVEVLDDAGKLLTTFNIQKSGSSHPVYTSQMKFNGSTVFSYTENYSPTMDSIVGVARPFSILINAGVVTFQYAGFTPITTTISDATGNWRKPTTLRLKFMNSGGPATDYGITLNVSNLKLFKDIL